MINILSVVKTLAMQACLQRSQALEPMEKTKTVAVVYVCNPRTSTVRQEAETREPPSQRLMGH